MPIDWRPRSADLDERRMAASKGMTGKRTTDIELPNEAQYRDASLANQALQQDEDARRAKTRKKTRRRSRGKKR